ncbi:MAG TPA: isoprenylcysteine carboxylmethyltransferase family protein, partial [Longimicrobiales bacterium]|nr:isoprenylcysteine carboxylmethyltransferase family protein [Longimicrobiales bacterium]
RPEGVVWRNPDTLEERARGFRAEGTRAWDRRLLPVVIRGSVAILVAAGLDHRFSWSVPPPPPSRGVALLLATTGYVLTGWAMAENRFFSGTVRIQRDRGHGVVSSGPYRLVRHPGYAGSLLGTLCVPIVLGSWWALAPAGLVSLALVLRTALEDDLLRTELEGYEAFAGRTRYRLVPGVW